MWVMITLYHISIILDTYQYFTDIGTSLKIPVLVTKPFKTRISLRGGWKYFQHPPLKIGTSWSKDAKKFPEMHKDKFRCTNPNKSAS